MQFIFSLNRFADVILQTPPAPGQINEVLLLMLLLQNAIRSTTTSENVLFFKAW